MEEKNIFALLEEAQESSKGKSIGERLKIMQDHAGCDYKTVIDFLSLQSMKVVVD